MASTAKKSEEPIYVSPPSPRSLKQTYAIYPDRIELRARVLFCTLKIPLHRITVLEARPKPTRHGIFRFQRIVEDCCTYNNDWACFCPHIYLRQKGWPSRIRFAPDYPERFVAACKELMGQVRRNRAAVCVEL